MSIEEFELIINDYRLDLPYVEPVFYVNTFRSKERLEDASYCNWALDELVAYVKKHPYKDRFSAVDEFARKMRNYMRKYRRTQRMFFVAADVADDIADILRYSYTAKTKLISEEELS